MANFGTNGADTITDDSGQRDINALAGNDLIIAANEQVIETIDGGQGVDTISFINLGHVQVNIGSAVPGGFGFADDTLDVLNSIENVIGSNGDDIITGSSGANELFGLAGNDLFEGGGGADRISGGAGSDTVVYEHSAAGVIVDLANGQGNGGEAEGDRFFSIEDVLGSSHDDVIGGTAAGNHLTGNDGRDWLLGNDGNDWLSGGGDDDMLNGGRGADQLIGGAGADTFRFTATGDSYAMIGHQDRVLDFNHSSADRLDFNWIDAKAGHAGEQDFKFIGDGAFTAEGQIRAYASQGDMIVEVNTAGHSGAEMSILIDDISSLSQTDFIL